MVIVTILFKLLTLSKHRRVQFSNSRIKPYFTLFSHLVCIATLNVSFIFESLSFGLLYE